MQELWVKIGFIFRMASEFEGEYDLTVTTAGEATVGNVMTFEGKIALDKDFGYGYFYKIIMEDGVVLSQVTGNLNQVSFLSQS